MLCIEAFSLELLTLAKQEEEYVFCVEVGHK